MFCLRVKAWHFILLLLLPLWGRQKLLNDKRNFPSQACKATAGKFHFSLSNLRLSCLRTHTFLLFLAGSIQYLTLNLWKHHHFAKWNGQRGKHPLAQAAWWCCAVNGKPTYPCKTGVPGLTWLKNGVSIFKWVALPSADSQCLGWCTQEGVDKNKTVVL